ncbi:hypothetical protein J28TS4_39090 [Paenibacillus lautus]|nr:hypothetical protein J28TS4_39090 [Paenibacillus lautus]
MSIQLSNVHERSPYDIDSGVINRFIVPRLHAKFLELDDFNGRLNSSGIQ